MAASNRRIVVAVWVAALAVAWLSGTEARAQIVGEGRPTPGQIDLAAAITLDVSDRPLEDVLEHIRSKVGISIVVPPGTEGKVTIKLREIPWQESLQLVAESAGCIATEVSSRLWRVEKPPRINMSFTGVDIKQVIESIAKFGNANIIVSDKIKGNVTMVVNNKPWRDALDAVVKTLNYHVVEEDRGILRVVDEAGLATNLERRLFQLHYLRPKSTYIARLTTDYVEDRPKTQNQQSQGAQSEVEKEKKRFPLLEALEHMLTKDGKMDYFDDQNAILVKDTKPTLDEIGRFLDRLDVEPVQIYFDVQFLTTSNTVDTDLTMGLANGIDASITGSSRPSRFPFNLGPGSFADNLIPGRASDNLNTFAPTGTTPFGNASSIVTPGTLDFSAIKVAIKLLKTDQDAQILQAPQISTVDHREATIFVGETVRYAQAEAASSQSGGLELSVKEADHSPVDTGFQLLVIPHVVPGTNRILMQVIPQARSLTGTTDPNLPGFDLFTVGAGSVGTGSISLPRVGSETLVTNLMLENGQTGILGGLVQDSTNKTVSKVPWLGDLPVLGAFFRSTTDHAERKKLIVFITPWIVNTSQHTDEMLKQQIQKVKDRTLREWEGFAEMKG